MKAAQSSDTIVAEIVIKASAERIFEALMDPRQRTQWWGAAGRFQATHMESDLRPGGAWMMSGTGMGGKPFVVRGEYRSVDRPRSIEFTWKANWDQEAPVTVVRFDLVEADGATTVKLTHSGLTGERSRENYRGWPWLLSMLQGFVEGKSTGAGNKGS